MAAGYHQKYIAPWFNFPSLSIGLFVLSLFMYLGNIYLIAETGDHESRNDYIHLAYRSLALMVILGALVFVLAERSPHHLLKDFFINPWSVACFGLATVLAVVFWLSLRRKAFTEWGIRLMAAGQVGLVLAAWLAVVLPNAIFYTNSSSLTLNQVAAPPLTIDILAWSLIIGAALFLPLLYYLIRTFKLS